MTSEPRGDRTVKDWVCTFYGLWGKLLMACLFDKSVNELNLYSVIIQYNFMVKCIFLVPHGMIKRGLWLC